MIILYIILGIIGWLFLGFVAHYLSFIRRKMSGLPTNYLCHQHYSNNSDEKHLPYNMIEGKYISLGYRTNPYNNDTIGMVVVLGGPISLFLWILCTTVFILGPVPIILIINGLALINHLVFKNELKLIKFKKFINKDVD